MKSFEGWRLINLFGVFSTLKIQMEAVEGGKNLEAKTLVNWTSLLKSMESHCTDLGLVVSVGLIENSVRETESGEVTASDVTRALDRITEVIVVETKSRFLLHIEPAMAHYYSGTELFGEEVARKFPSASFDIEEAGKCLALDRGTACVFHLMRVLEIGLYALADALDIKNIQINWQNAIEQIEKAIRTLDKKSSSLTGSKKLQADGKINKQFYSEAASHFIHVKDAWRNNAVHSGQIYPVEKAESIYDNVLEFMQLLATRLEESK